MTDFAEAEYRQEQVRERREVAGRAHRPLRGHAGVGLGIDEPRHPVEQLRTHARAAAREARELEHEGEAHDRVGQQRADTGAVRQHDIALQLRALRRRNARVGEQAETRVDAGIKATLHPEVAGPERVLQGVVAKGTLPRAAIGVATCGTGSRGQAGGHAAVGIAAGRCTTKNALQYAGQVARVAVLHAVDVQLGLGTAVAGPVEAFDPAARLVQVGGARGDDQDAVDALYGQHAQCAKQGVVFSQRRGRGGTCLRSGLRGSGAGPGRCRPAWCRCGGAAAARDEPQGGLDLGHGGVFEREYAHRHALEQVYVEGVDDFQPAFGLAACAGEDQQVAHGVHAQQAVGGHHGAQDGGHFARAYVLQRHDDGPHAGRHGGGVDLAYARADALERIGAADVVAAARVAHHCQAIHRECAVEQEHGLVRGHGCPGGQGDGAIERRVQPVFDLEQVAQDGAHDLGDGRLFKAEADGRAGQRRRRLGRRDDLVVAAQHAWLALGGGVGPGVVTGLGSRGRGLRRGHGAGRWRGGLCQRHLAARGSDGQRKNVLVAWGHD